MGEFTPIKSRILRWIFCESDATYSEKAGKLDKSTWLSYILPEDRLYNNRDVVRGDPPKGQICNLNLLWMYQDQVIVTSTVYSWNRFCPNQETRRKTQYEIKIWKRANMYPKPIINAPRSGNCDFNNLFPEQIPPKPSNMRLRYGKEQICILNLL